MKNIRILLSAVLIFSVIPLAAQKVEIPSMPQEKAPATSAKASAAKSKLEQVAAPGVTVAEQVVSAAAGPVLPKGEDAPSAAVSLPKQTAAARAFAAKPVKFDPQNKRDPFLSKEEVETIEAARRAEQKRIEEEKKRLEDEARARHEALERQRRLEEELKKYPARAIMDKINVDGILGSEAIINGEIKGIGDTVLGAKVIKVTGDSVTFIFKGQTFKRNLPLTQ